MNDLNYLSFNNSIIDIKKLLEFEEGKRLKVYKCTQGFLTVGIGHNLISNPAKNILNRTLKLGDLITENECSLLFEQDLKEVYDAIKKTYHISIR